MQGGNASIYRVGLHISAFRCHVACGPHDAPGKAARRLHINSARLETRPHPSGHHAVQPAHASDSRKHSLLGPLPLFKLDAHSHVDQLDVQLLIRVL